MRNRIAALCAVVALGSVSIVPVSAADIRQGLVAYWQMDGLNGAIVPDLTPFSNHLTGFNLSGGNFFAGQFGNALSNNWNSPFSYATNLHSPDPTISGLPIYRAGRYTITMWVKGPAQTNKYLYAEASTAITAPLLILQTGNAAANAARFDVIIRDDVNGTRVNHVVSAAVVFDNNWHHIAWVDDLGSVRLYIDGNLDPANFNYTPSGTFTMNSTAIGTLVRNTIATGNIFVGLIDDVGVWRRALSAAEVQEVRTNSLITPIPAFPPSFALQPVGSTNRVGDRVTFSALVDGNPPIGLQWLKDNVEIPGATLNSLSFSNLVATNSGDYVLRATNNFGTNFSNPATLLVIPDPAPDLRRGIVSYWSMDDEGDEGGNGIIYDSYGSNDFKAVALGGFIDLAPGMFLNAAQFNGSDQYLLQEGGFPAYNNPVYSVAFWVNASASQSDRRLFAESATNDLSSVFSFGTQTNATGTLHVIVRNHIGQTVLDRSSTRTVFDDTWHHVVWTETNGEARLYIDGVLDETTFNYTRQTLFFNATIAGALLRAGGASNYFNGLVDELAIWNRLISFGEVQQLRTNAVPAPLADVGPSITAHPVSRSVFTRANVSFNFAASGTGPLSWNWRKNGTNLPAQTNVNLVLNNVTLADAGDYDALVANAVGGATSQVATLTVTLRPVITNLQVDVNNLGADNSPANTEPGFSVFTLDAAVNPEPVVRQYGGAEVTLFPVNVALQSRKRPLPLNSNDFTQERLLQDFIFTPDSVAGQGLDVAIDFLESSQPYALTIWSFDQVNTGRISDWFANGITLTNGYTFNGTALPTNNSTYRFTFPVTADANGRILLQMRRGTNATVANSVFLNAFQVTPVQASNEIRVTSIALTTTNTLHLTVSGISPAATRRVEQITNVTDSVWTDVSGAVFSAPSGNTVEAIIPVPGTFTRFYRVVETP